jgi:hypothetical protein
MSQSPCFFTGLALLVLLSGPVAADDGAAVVASSPAAIPNPLDRDYVDLGLHFGPAFHGTVVDSRYSAVGYGGGMTLDIGRPPYWGGVYADVGMFSGKSGVVDPLNNERPKLGLTSAGWRGKAAIRLSPRLFVMPALGVGFGLVDYLSGACGRYTKGNCHNARTIGLGIQATASFVYAWRFVAVTFEPLQVNSFLFERRSMSVVNALPDAGVDLGLSRHGVAFASSLGISLDLSAMVLGIRDSIVDVGRSIAGP